MNFTHTVPLRYSILVLTFFCLIQSALSQVKIKFDNPKRTFSVGENISLRIGSSGGGTGTYELTFDPTNPSATFQKGTFEANGGQDGVINFRVNSPGMVFVRVNQNGSDMKTIAVEPFNIKPLDAEPIDFDAFWQAQKSKLAAVPINPQLSEIQTLPNGSKVYIISLDQIDNRKVWGYLCVPSGGSGKYPAVLSLPPFSTSPLQPEQLILTDFAERCGAISMAITVHNVPPNQTDPNAYRPDNLDKRDEYYAKYMILAGLRAVDYLLSRPDCNGSIGVTGNSQGGGLTASVVGLDNRITAAMPIASASMEQDGWRFNRASGFPHYARSGVSSNFDSTAVFKNMKYYDAAFFMKRYKGQLMFQTGYLDDLTPAATQIDGYNQNHSKSVFLHMLNRGHDYPFEEYFLGRYAFFAQYLKDFTNFSNFKMVLDINAGDDKNIIGNSTELSAAVNINNSGSPSNIRWMKVEGTGNVNFANPNALKTTVQFSQAGIYILKLMADYDYKVDNEFEPLYYTLTDYITITVGSGGGDPCDSDAIPPTISNCPQNINLITQGTFTTATWQTPTATDACSPPSVFSNYNSGDNFNLGATTVTYTATDAKGNKTTCSFTVTVTQQGSASGDCLNYSVGSTNDICSCSSTKWVPFGFYFSDGNGCPKEYFIPENDVQFSITSDGFANLKGTFRSRNWENVLVNVLFLGKSVVPPLGSPNIIDCTRDSIFNNINGWQYYTGMAGTIKIGDRPPLSIERRGTAFQIGKGANNQNSTLLGASGDFRLSDGRIGAFAFSLLNPEGSACEKDLSIALSTDKQTYQKRTFMDFTITVKNNTTQVFKDIIVNSPFPIGIVTGGNVSVSTGLWKEWCTDNVHCYNWDIPMLSANGTASLKIPVFVQDINTSLTFKAKIITSTPVDNNLDNNEAIITLLSSNEEANLDTPTTQRPLVLQRISPNPTENDIIVDYNSLIKENITFKILNNFGDVIKIYERTLQKGQNSVYFDGSDLPSGVFYILTNINGFPKVKLKFVKMR
jgi:cephalosporin-C deacetylase